MSEMTGGQVIAKMLRAEGVEKFFGIIDGTYLQLFAHCVEEGIEMITPRHEAVAAHMAGAYARLTGKLGVCIASSGGAILPGEAPSPIMWQARQLPFLREYAIFLPSSAAEAPFSAAMVVVATAMPPTAITAESAALAKYRFIDFMFIFPKTWLVL